MKKLDNVYFIGDDEDFMDFLKTAVENLKPHLAMSTDDWEKFFEDKSDEEIIEWVRNKYRYYFYII